MRAVLEDLRVGSTQFEYHDDIVEAGLLLVAKPTDLAHCCWAELHRADK